MTITITKTIMTTTTLTTIYSQSFTIHSSTDNIINSRRETLMVIVLVVGFCQGLCATGLCAKLCYWLCVKGFVSRAFCREILCKHVVLLPELLIGIEFANCATVRSGLWPSAKRVPSIVAASCRLQYVLSKLQWQRLV